VEGVVCDYIIEIDQNGVSEYVEEASMKYEDYPADGFRFRFEKGSSFGSKFSAGAASVYLYVGTPTSDYMLVDTWDIMVQETTE
jgi:hypothetical protein